MSNSADLTVGSLPNGVLCTTAALEPFLNCGANGSTQPLREQLRLDGITCRSLADSLADAGLPHLLLLDATSLSNGQADTVAGVLNHLAAADTPHTCVLVGEDALPHYHSLLQQHGMNDNQVFAVLPRAPQPRALRQVTRQAIDHCALQHKARSMEQQLQRHAHHLKELNSIGVALSSQRDLDQLLELILTKSRAITGSDASSLYLVETDPQDGSRLRFKLSQNDSLTFSVDKPMAISKQSLAGYVALTGETLCFEDVYNLPAGVPYSFNRSFDQAHGYRSKSMLVVPMRNHQGDIIGVLQLINRKTAPHIKLLDDAVVEQAVLPYGEEELELASSLASQAAVAIENSTLYQSIENLFEGFVTASARAIDQRDPTTSGHSERVAILTLGLADVVSRMERGPYADTHFTPSQIKELRYSALLHDFGKVGVREDVLLKRNKLHEHQYELLRMRFDLVRTLRERDLSERKVQALLQEDREVALAQFPAWEKELEDEMREMDEFLLTVSRANDPIVQWTEDSEYEKHKSVLSRMCNVFYRDRDKHLMPLLQDHELRALTIRRGSLGEEERREIQRHVNHTFEFLQQIPWTRDYAMVPMIALCHHERCDGTGYPYGLRAEQIPVQTRMMTIVDIYDALTASDRPYKRACSTDTAIDILYEEARDDHIDRDLVDVFVTERIWKLTAGWKKQG